MLFLKNLLFGWAFKLLSYYKITPPTLENLFEIPKSLDISHQIIVLKANWQEELRKPKPSFFNAIRRIVYKDYLFCIFLLSIYQSQNVFQAILVKYIIDFIYFTENPAYQGALLTLAYILSCFLFCAFKKQFDYRSILLPYNAVSLPVWLGLLIFLMKKVAPIIFRLRK